MEGSLSTVHVVGFHEVILTTVGWKLNVTQLSLSRRSGEVFRRWNITDFGFFFSLLLLLAVREPRGEERKEDI